MLPQGVSFFPRSEPGRLGWTSRETAEIYRLTDTLVRHGVTVEFEAGVSDEGDPWLALIDRHSGEVVAHVARADGVYMVDRLDEDGASDRELVYAHTLREVFDVLLPSPTEAEPVAAPEDDFPGIPAAEEYEGGLGAGDDGDAHPESEGAGERAAFASLVVAAIAATTVTHDEGAAAPSADPEPVTDETAGRESQARFAPPVEAAADEVDAAATGSPDPGSPAATTDGGVPEVVDLESFVVGEVAGAIDALLAADADGPDADQGPQAFAPADEENFDLESLDDGEAGALIEGSAAAELIEAGGGADTIMAGAGNDTVFAGAGDDVAIAGDGDDLVDGGAGNDSLVGGNGNDTLVDGAGDDTLVGGAGDDVLVNGAGDDLILGDAAPPLSGGTDTNTADGGAGSDQIFAYIYEPGARNVVSGGPGEDVFVVIAPDGGTVVIEGFEQGLDRVITIGTDVEILFSQGGVVSDSPAVPREPVAALTGVGLSGFQQFSDGVLESF